MIWSKIVDFKCQKVFLRRKNIWCVIQFIFAILFFKKNFRNKDNLITFANWLSYIHCLLYTLTTTLPNVIEQLNCWVMIKEYIKKTQRVEQVRWGEGGILMKLISRGLSSKNNWFAGRKSQRTIFAKCISFYYENKRNFTLGSQAFYG